MVAIIHLFRLIYSFLILLIFRKNLAKALEIMGPAFIKLGQFLSTRPDIIGVKLAESLSYLRDKLPYFSYDEVVKIIEKEFGKGLNEIFSFIEEIPVASASIAQVHRAITIDGEEVAVKIRRPGIKKLLLKDVHFFYSIAKFVELFLPKYKRLKLKELVSTLEKSFYYELDLRLEAAAADKIRANNQLDSVIIPKIYWLITSERVLTMQWVEGFSVSDLANIEKNSINIIGLAKNFAIAFLTQAFDDGYFHADLHQGNIMVTHEGKIVFVDFGIVGSLDQKNRVYVARILHGFVKRNYSLVAKLHQEAGYIPEDVDITLFEQNLRAIGEQIMNLPPEKISMAKLLGYLLKITEEFNMEAQPQLLLLQKTMVMVEGIGKMLAPSNNLWVLAEDWINSWAKRNLSYEVKVAKLIKKTIFNLLK